MASGIAVKLPLSLDENDGAYGLLKDYLDLAKQNLKMLILTSPGERIMEMNYGVGLREYLFEPNLESVYNDISAKIYEQVEIYMPYIEIEDLIISPMETEESGVSIKIYFKVIPIGESDLLEFDQKIQ